MFDYGIKDYDLGYFDMSDPGRGSGARAGWRCSIESGLDPRGPISTFRDYEADERHPRISAASASAGPFCG
jgi:hypothetical protein